MAFTFGYSPWLLGLSLLLAGGLTYWTYRSTIPSLAPGWRWLLGGLRFTSLFLLCFLLLEPVLRTIQKTSQPPVIAVLVDNSRSMRLTTGNPADTSDSSVRDRLRSILAPLENELSGTIRFFSFDREVRSLSTSPLDSLTFDGARSDIGAAIRGATDELQGQNLRGIAVLSDGQYNSGQNPVRVADRGTLPIHTITVGDTSRQRDLQIRRVVTNDVAYVDTEVPVRVTIASNDLGGQTTSVSLAEGGAVRDTTTVSLPSGSAEIPLDLGFRPDSAGLKELTVRASPVDGEVTTQNNVRSVSLRVLENKRHALLLGAAPSPSFAAIRRVMERDANTDLSAHVPQLDGSFYGGALPDSLSQFDVVVCAGFPSSVVPQDAIERVATLIDDGTPAMFLLDRQTDLSAWRGPFEFALPVIPPDADLRFTDAVFSPVASERSHPVLQIDDARTDLFRRLPPLTVPTAAWTPSPDARVLGHVSRPSLSREDPILVVRRRGGHRTAAFLATDTWRWATLPAQLAPADPLWPGLVSNLMRWVTTQSDDRPVRVRPVSVRFDGDESVEFSGQVYDESMSPVSGAAVSVVIEDSTGTEYPHSMEPIGNGRYELNVGPLPGGTYQYEASARLDETLLGRDQGSFSVGSLRLEAQQTRANAVLMRRLAARSGGQAYTGTAGQDLASDLNNSSTFTSSVATETTEAELWRRTAFLLAILALLAAEWTLRKRFGLT